VLGKLGDDFTPQAVPTKTGKESLSERWILHKFNEASKLANENLTKREFSDAAIVIYQYWYAQLCDVFIENSKSLLAPDVAPEIQQSAKETLYTALEGALKLIHPIMPFVTEELWQRLPRRPGDDTISIMKAFYPEYNPAFDDPAAETAYELILATSKAIRSIQAEYEVKTKTDIKVQTYDATSYATISEEVSSIKSLGGKNVGDITVLSPENTEPPSQCVVTAVGASAAVYLPVSQEVLLEQEDKAKKDLAKAEEAVRKQQAIMNAPSWKEKVRPEVQEMEEKKLRDAQSEAARFQEHILQLEKLRI
jgi:valyl-tRNA synthetase